MKEIGNEAMAGTGRDEETSQPGGARVSVVTVTYNSRRHLKAFLDSLQTGLDGIQDFEVVIADNASSDDSVAIALSHPVRPRVINVGWNSGYAGGINAAVATVGKDSTLLVLNPDVRLLPGAARLLMNRLLDPTVGVAVPKILDEDGRLTLSLRREPSLKTAWTDAVVGGKLGTWIGTGEKISDPTRYTADGFADWAEGSAMAISARVRKLVGDWDESFFLYSEEVDYMRRVRAVGLSIAYVSGAEVIHIGGESGTNPSLSALLTRNRVQYYRRHHGFLLSAMFQTAVVLGEGVRVGTGPTHRAALWAALTAQ
ncbi:glycosyltransferase family 2 protein [Mesorhizobium sp. B2-6-2]|uniref:glycosyltransferase family 2 protein n=1 Tax=Mesorhizobium sp. B2-6-2 TaxID=2589915 RepID=UPI001FEDAB70|nr:glycosyltransferase family 2 protein [Mesorhizobium sp. B2-6-2]